MLTTILSLPTPATKTPFLLSFPTAPWAPPRRPPLLPPVRMGGGPRTYPGGVSKWQWKRMQAKKAKQLLKARLLRERQVYEMRKRAELRAAVAELEKPWELVDRAPTLLSVSADEQLKALADRFQRPGGFDMWSDRDGPQVFGDAESAIPTQRFFPKGAVHSLRPYGLVGDGDEAGFDDWIARGGGSVRRRRRGGERREGDRRIVDEKKDVDSGFIDVEARSVDESGAESLSDHSELKNQQDARGSPHVNGKNLAETTLVPKGASRHVRRGAKVALRPTSDLNTNGGNHQIRDSKWKDRAGPRRNQGRSL